MPASSRPRPALLPDFCHARVIFVVILLAELLAIVLALAQPAYVQDRLFSLALYSMFTQCIAISAAATLCLGRNRLNTLPDNISVTISFLLILLVAFVIIELVWWSFARWTIIDSTLGAHLEFVLRALAITAIAAALTLRYFYVQQQWRRNVELESNARFDALQARIRPHFFFNCMNTIASLTRRDASKAEQAVEDLADLFRASLQDRQQQSTLQAELDLCRRYLNIEAQRLGDRLVIDWDVGQLDEQSSIPTLTLQPLLENAIYHGIEPRTEGGRIRIDGDTADQQNRIRITNPKPDPSSQAHADGNHLAQDNIRQRLQAVFAEAATMTITEDDTEYFVELRFPVIHSEDINR